jgi:hypothetical protein
VISVFGGRIENQRGAMTEAEAEEALRSRDWPGAQSYVFDLLGSDLARGTEWICRLSEAALPQANAGDVFAQHVMGTLHTWRFLWELGPPREELERALSWFMSAARHDHADEMIGQVAHWYELGRSRGLSNAAVDAFFEEPDIKLRWQRCGGAQ